MADTEKDNIFRSLFRMPRFAPAFFAAFLAGVLLLFLDKVSWRVKTYLIPAIVIYAMGAAFLGYLHRLLGLHYESRNHSNNEKPIPIKWKAFLYMTHFLWLVAFIIYNIYRGVL